MHEDRGAAAARHAARTVRIMAGTGRIPVNEPRRRSWRRRANVRTTPFRQTGKAPQPNA